MATTTTTVVVPDQYTAYYAYTPSLGPISSVTPSVVMSTAATTPPSSVLDEGFTLYMTTKLDAQAEININDLILELYGNGPSTSGYPAAWYTGEAIGTGITTLTSYPVGPITVPIIASLGTVVSLSSWTASLNEAYERLVGPAGQGSPGPVRAEPSDATPSPPNAISAATSSTALASSLGSTAASTGTSSSNDTSPSRAANTGISQSTLGGAVAGGTIGGLLVGAAICFLIFMCCFKNRASSSRSTHVEDADETAKFGAPAEHKTPRALERSTAVVGWQKHLPQEKNSRAIQNTFEILFEQVRVHVEGFYGSSRGKLSDEAAASLRAVSEDRLHEKATRVDDIVPVLQAILTRWIVHRISLRSGVEDSLLPAEYTSIPETRKLHTERDAQGRDTLGASKPGLPQAFSEWRMLTGFIRAEPQSDIEYGRTLNAKINRAVHALGEAFSPWQLPNKSASNRFESLQRILEEASRAGIMLFQQRSLYVFDWSSDHRGGIEAFTVTPALVKELDEHGEAMRSAEILIKAT